MWQKVFRSSQNYDGIVFCQCLMHQRMTQIVLVCVGGKKICIKTSNSPEHAFCHFPNCFLRQNLWRCDLLLFPEVIMCAPLKAVKYKRAKSAHLNRSASDARYELGIVFCKITLRISITSDKPNFYSCCCNWLANYCAFFSGRINFSAGLLPSANFLIHL